MSLSRGQGGLLHIHYKASRFGFTWLWQKSSRDSAPTGPCHPLDGGHWEGSKLLLAACKKSHGFLPQSGVPCSARIHATLQAKFSSWLEGLSVTRLLFKDQHCVYFATRVLQLDVPAASLILWATKEKYKDKRADNPPSWQMIHPSSHFMPRACPRTWLSKGTFIPIYMVGRKRGSRAKKPKVKPTSWQWRAIQMDAVSSFHM